MSATRAASTSAWARLIALRVRHLLLRQEGVQNPFARGTRRAASPSPWAAPDDGRTGTARPKKRAAVRQTPPSPFEALREPLPRSASAARTPRQDSSPIQPGNTTSVGSGPEEEPRKRSKSEELALKSAQSVFDFSALKPAPLLDIPAPQVALSPVEPASVLSLSASESADAAEATQAQRSSPQSDTTPGVPQADHQDTPSTAATLAPSGDTPVLSEQVSDVGVALVGVETLPAAQTTGELEQATHLDGKEGEPSELTELTEPLSPVNPPDHAAKEVQEAAQDHSAEIDPVLIESARDGIEPAPASANSAADRLTDWVAALEEEDSVEHPQQSQSNSSSSDVEDGQIELAEDEAATDLEWDQPALPLARTEDNGQWAFVFGPDDLPEALETGQEKGNALEAAKEGAPSPERLDSDPPLDEDGPEAIQLQLDWETEESGWLEEDGQWSLALAWPWSDKERAALRLQVSLAKHQQQAVLLEQETRAQEAKSENPLADWVAAGQLAFNWDQGECGWETPEGQWAFAFTLNTRDSALSRAQWELLQERQRHQDANRAAQTAILGFQERLELERNAQWLVHTGVQQLSLDWSRFVAPASPLENQRPLSSTIQAWTLGARPLLIDARQALAPAAAPSLRIEKPSLLNPEDFLAILAPLDEEWGYHSLEDEARENARLSDLEAQDWEGSEARAAPNHPAFEDDSIASEARLPEILPEVSFANGHAIDGESEQPALGEHSGEHSNASTIGAVEPPVPLEDATLTPIGAPAPDAAAVVADAPATPDEEFLTLILREVLDTSPEDASSASQDSGWEQEHAEEDEASQADAEAFEEQAEKDEAAAFLHSLSEPQETVSAPSLVQKEAESTPDNPAEQVKLSSRSAEKEMQPEGRNTDLEPHDGQEQDALPPLFAQAFAAVFGEMPKPALSSAQSTSPLSAPAQSPEVFAQALGSVESSEDEEHSAHAQATEQKDRAIDSEDASAQSPSTMDLEPTFIGVDPVVFSAPDKDAQQSPGSPDAAPVPLETNSETAPEHEPQELASGSLGGLADGEDAAEPIVEAAPSIAQGAEPLATEVNGQEEKQEEKQEDPDVSLPVLPLSELVSGEAETAPNAAEEAASGVVEPNSLVEAQPSQSAPTGLAGPAQPLRETDSKESSPVVATEPAVAEEQKTESVFAHLFGQAKEALMGQERAKSRREQSGTKPAEKKRIDLSLLRRNQEAKGKEFEPMTPRADLFLARFLVNHPRALLGLRQKQNGKWAVNAKIMALPVRNDTAWEQERKVRNEALQAALKTFWSSATPAQRELFLTIVFCAQHHANGLTAISFPEALRQAMGREPAREALSTWDEAMDAQEQGRRR